MDRLAYDQLSAVDPTGRRHVIIETATLASLIDSAFAPEKEKQTIIDQAIEQLKEGEGGKPTDN